MITFDVSWSTILRKTNSGLKCKSTFRHQYFVSGNELVKKAQALVPPATHLLWRYMYINEVPSSLEISFQNINQVFTKRILVVINLRTLTQYAP